MLRCGAAIACRLHWRQLIGQLRWSPRPRAPSFGSSPYASSRASRRCMLVRQHTLRLLLAVPYGSFAASLHSPSSCSASPPAFSSAAGPPLRPFRRLFLFVLRLVLLPSWCWFLRGCLYVSCVLVVFLLLFIRHHLPAPIPRSALSAASSSSPCVCALCLYQCFAPTTPVFSPSSVSSSYAYPSLRCVSSTLVSLFVSRRHPQRLPSDAVSSATASQFPSSRNRRHENSTEERARSANRRPMDTRHLDTTPTAPGDR